MKEVRSFRPKFDVVNFVMTSFGIRIFESSTGKAQKYQDAEWALDFGTKEAVMPKRKVIAN